MGVDRHYAVGVAVFLLAVVGTAGCLGTLTGQYDAGDARLGGVTVVNDGMRPYTVHYRITLDGTVVENGSVRVGTASGTDINAAVVVADEYVNTSGQYEIYARVEGYEEGDTQTIRRSGGTDDECVATSIDVGYHTARTWDGTATPPKPTVSGENMLQFFGDTTPPADGCGYSGPGPPGSNRSE